MCYIHVHVFPDLCVGDSEDPFHKAIVVLFLHRTNGILSMLLCATCGPILVTYNLAERRESAYNVVTTHKRGGMYTHVYTHRDTAVDCEHSIYQD